MGLLNLVPTNDADGNRHQKCVKKRRERLDPRNVRNKDPVPEEHEDKCANHDDEHENSEFVQKFGDCLGINEAPEHF